METEVLTSHEAAELLGTTPVYVRQLIHEGKIERAGYAPNPKGGGALAVVTADSVRAYALEMRK